MNERISFAEVPKGLMSAMMAVEAYVSAAEFDIKLLELIRLRVSYINQCAYCIDMHFKEAMAAGEELQRLYSITEWEGTSYYSAEERACFAWAEYLTLSGVLHDEKELFEDLLNFFDKEKIANLTMVIVQINAWNQLMKSFSIEAGNYQVGQH